MNKKEVSEIKRNFNSDSGSFTLSRVLTAFVDSEKNIKCKNVRAFASIEESEAELIMNALKKVFSGKLSKNLLEYQFPYPCFGEGGTQNILYSAVKSGLEDEQKTDALLSHIASNVQLETTYALFVGFCRYSVFKKSKDSKKYDDSDSSYSFIVTALCPVAVREEGLVYDQDANAIIKKPSSDRVVAGSPSDGFIYPVFSCGGSDVNRVMYYTRKPKDPNTSIINGVLGCEFIASSTDEKTAFRNILSSVVADELDLGVITSVNEKIAEVIAENQDETDPPVIDKPRLGRILSESGVSDEKLQNLDSVFDKVAGQTEMKASNLLENKTVVTVPSVMVRIGKDGLDKVRIQSVEGRRCLIISLDDPEVSVNGINC